MFKILVINPGSTSTKIAVFEDENPIFEQIIRHTMEELAEFPSIYAQYDFRKKIIIQSLEKNRIDISGLAAVVGRGGAVRPLMSGTYIINEKFKEDCRVGYSGQHASNLGSILADEIARERGIPSFVVDPPAVDEMSELARLTGFPGMRRKSRFHALNQKASARKAAGELGKKYEETNIIVAHLGSGISIGVHEKGKVVDVNDCYDSEGPIMPERAGTLPVGQVVEMCFSGKYSLEEIKKKLTGKGGLVALLGTNDLNDVVRRIEAGDRYAELIYEAIAYQTAKFIGSSAAVLKGQVDTIVLTGGMALDNELMELIKKRVAWIAPIKVYPGDNEMESLAMGALKVLKGIEEAREYDKNTILEE